MIGLGRWRRRPARLAGVGGSAATRRDRRAELAERLRELARDDPDLVCLSLRDLRKHLEVLVGEQLRVGVAGVDRLEHRLDRLRLALRVQPLRLTLALGPQDRALLLPLGGQALRLLHALRLEY